MGWGGAAPAVPVKLRAAGLVEIAKELTGAHSRRMPMVKTFSVQVVRPRGREGRPIEAALSLSVWID